MLNALRLTLLLSLAPITSFYDDPFCTRDLDTLRFLLDLS